MKNEAKAVTCQWLMHSDIGRIYLIASEKGLREISWSKQAAPMLKSLKDSRVEARVLAKAVRELEEYFKGKRKSFDVPLDDRGTPFQRRVWAELRKIPYGKTRSYAEIATRIKNPKAVRAVGNANGKNPLCIIVPCHRVITSSGMIGGYSGPKGVKEHLLDLEQQ